ncbi:AraC family transcriptional regulator [Halorubrum sp. Ib24]|uniref:DJ-1/PfpI family protein n=1 Tax=unclassified Halorubrum TaxID=2642239 RepID=UPI000B99094C|nr:MULTISPECIES: DJ-1/PfpI family protein [unclassified Halorubrum]OYR38340.1 AraC family transcriptional regulator [Halorubrum sp. Ib24]OYR40730.1 AraC family transcriptional regulator [Halorubrum sp. Hd13]OYR47464.1 AraC family transcriptional regulator [Halorubrum sp. Ea8]OYR48069.1 AraC family transcriptional regulator [Halorubrum sp. Eb13]OYR50898.1 AraC family transcriptional regulator [Halorubrum sp. Ea1]
MNVDVLLYDGFDELDGIGPYEVFDYALEYAGEGDDPAGRVRYVTLGERDSVTASHGTRVGVDGTLPEPDADDVPDLLLVPGGGWNARDAEASAWAEARKGDVPRALAAHHAAGTRIASVCTGSMLLAEAGVTDGRRAVTHAGAIDELRESGAEVVDARVVDDGDLLSAGGVTSGIDLALYLVEREFGGDVADRVATVIEYERRYEVAGGGGGD